MTETTFLGRRAGNESNSRLRFCLKKMTYKALLCPQCGGPLPRQALWRVVPCPYCNTNVTRCSETVQAADFHDASKRVWSAVDLGGSLARLGMRSYRLLAPLGAGEHASVWLGERVSPLPERVTLKLAHTASEADILATEAGNLRQLQALQTEGAAYFSQRLPQVVQHAFTDDQREALVLRRPTGYWGSLARVLELNPDGIEAAHGVWMWRRTLEVLRFVHAAGWAHCRLSPAHLLVQPRDHGILIIGWRAARSHAPAAFRARDLQQTALSIMAVLCGGDPSAGLPPHTPPALAELLDRAGTDTNWCIEQGATGLEAALTQAAQRSFGPPRFIPFHPGSPGSGP